jgi:Tfp pilus assembly protein PilW
MKNRKRRGATLFEVIIGASVTAMTLTAGVSLFVGSMMNWAKGSGSLDSINSAQNAVRFISTELREATVATVSADGTAITYSVPRRSVDGSYAMPISNDPIPRTIRVMNGQLQMVVGTAVRTLAKDIVLTDPVTNTGYRVFTGDSATLCREVDIQVAISKLGIRNNREIIRARDSLLLKNVAVVSR